MGRPAKVAVILFAVAATALMGVLCVKVAIGPGQPQEPTVQEVVAEEPPATAPAVVRPSETIDERLARLGLDGEPSGPPPLSPADLFAKASPAVVRVVVRDKDYKVVGMGSGFFVSADGLLVTNYHVIKGAAFATVRLSNNATLFVNGVAATDPDADLALLKVNGADLPFLTVSVGHPPTVGVRVYAIGNPKGLTNTLSEGLISGLRKVGSQLRAIQTTAPISRGSSGGPLLAASGEVVGVTSAYIISGQNLNFAVPAGEVTRLLRKPGKLQTLASAGGTRLDQAESAELDKAWVAIFKEDWSAATKILIRLRKTQRDNPVVWYSLAYLHSELGNHDIAVDNYMQAIALKPDYADAYHNMGFAYNNMKRHAEAIAAYKKGIALKPDRAETYFNMGAAYGDMGRHAEEIAAYKKAIALKPDHAKAYFNMGAAHATLGRHAHAMAALN